MTIEEKIKKASNSKGLRSLLEGKFRGLILRFSGNCWGDTPGVSFANGGYDTVANGYCENFYRSRVKKGEKFSHEGKGYVCLRNTYSEGDAFYPTTHTFIAEEV